MATKAELLRRADLYAQRHGLVLGEQLGSGIHGIVFVAESQTEPGRAAIKVHEREAPYQRERDVYLRLQDHGVSEIRGCHVPQLLRCDDELWLIEMEVVTRPFVLDFAGAYLGGKLLCPHPHLSLHLPQRGYIPKPRVAAQPRTLGARAVYLLTLKALHNLGRVATCVTPSA